VSAVDYCHRHHVGVGVCAVHFIGHASWRL
jgi:hypothetical protein